MAHRLSTIATRTGDDGTTGLGDGSRVAKDSVRVHCIGEVDELNAFIGVWTTEPLPADISADLAAIQQDLFNLGAELCMPGHAYLPEQAVQRLDERLAAYNASLPRLREFILPGGTRAAALAHVCRTVCRRMERSLVHLATQCPEAPPSVTARWYCNRLSDLFFVLGRVLFQRERGQSAPESQWLSPRSASAPDSAD